MSSLAHAAASQLHTHRATDKPVLAYSVKDAAASVGVSVRTIWRLIGTGELATFKLGCRTLIRAEALKDLLDRHSTAA